MKPIDRTLLKGPIDYNENDEKYNWNVWYKTSERYLGSTQIQITQGGLGKRNSRIEQE